MRKININLVKKIVSELCIEANIKLRSDILLSLKASLKRERNLRARRMLEILIENAVIAKKESLPICQDTGMAVVFMEIGQDIHFTGGLVSKAVNDGIKDGYLKGYLRKSVVADPLCRINTKTNAPAVIHYEIVKGSKLKITVFPKGFGSENKSVISMFLPTQEEPEIDKFIINAVKNAGPDACPPYIVGVGIGGTLDKAVFLSKKALLTDLRKSNPKKNLSLMEKRILAKINKLNIGPMGIGGETTALGVKILSFPTHIAGLPVAVNIGCHATRSASREI